MSRLKTLKCNFSVIKSFFSTNSSNNMKFLQFYCKTGGPQRLGVQVASDGDIIDLSSVSSSIPNNFLDFLSGGPELMRKAKRIVAEGNSIVLMNDVTVIEPITKPDKVICVALNYKSHCDEQNKPYPSEPFFFNKFPSTIIGPTGNVKHPNNTRALDWEVELAIIIGKIARNVKSAQVNDVIFGYTIANDISARDWQTSKRNGGQWLFGKSMDTFCPLGPSIVPKENVCDPCNLKLTCKVNGELMQNGNTNDMVHSIYDIVSYLSQLVTLLPGDVILTGTPSGVGVFKNPKKFLKVGDIVETEISGIGALKNEIVSP